MTTTENSVDMEFVEKWIEALESGEYEQGQGFLHTAEGKMCCLGVACELDHLAGGVERVDPVCDKYAYADGASTCLPRALQKRLGLGDLGGGVVPDSEVGPLSLVSLNDSGFTFSQIADVLRWHYGLPRKADA